MSGSVKMLELFTFTWDNEEQNLYQRRDLWTEWKYVSSIWFDYFAIALGLYIFKLWQNSYKTLAVLYDGTCIFDDIGIFRLLNCASGSEPYLNWHKVNIQPNLSSSLLIIPLPQPHVQKMTRSIVRYWGPTRNSPGLIRSSETMMMEGWKCFSSFFSLLRWMVFISVNGES